MIRAEWQMALATAFIVVLMALMLLLNGCAFQRPYFSETITQPDGTVTTTEISGSVVAIGGSVIKEAQTGVDYTGPDWKLEFRGGNESAESAAIPVEILPALLPLLRMGGNHAESDGDTDGGGPAAGGMLPDGVHEEPDGAD